VYGKETYRYISEVLSEAKVLHKKDFIKSSGKSDHEQSWRAFKGKNLEKLLLFILSKEVRALGLDLVQGNALERSSNSLGAVLDKVKRNLLIDYGEFGMHLPDVDIIIYDPRDSRVLAVVSVKVTLRERIAQTGYWKLKLLSSDVTKDVKVYFITPDEDETLATRKPTKKGRAIVEVDTDGSYVMSESKLEQSNKVKTFNNFIADLKLIAKERAKNNKPSSLNGFMNN
jgi:type II restriction enzyme